MPSILRHVLRRPSPAMVVAIIALVLAASGTTYALTIPAASVGPVQLRPGAVTFSKLAAGQITSIKVRDNSLVGTDINEGTLASNYVALVRANGSLAFGSPGVRVVSHSGKQTVVEFPVSVVGHPVLASVAGKQAGQVAGGPCGVSGSEGGGCGSSGGPTRAVVSTFSAGGSPAERPFFVMVPRGPS
jgi:hypothetical protein